MRPQAWVITETKSKSEDDEDSFDVAHGRNSISTGMHSMSNARAIVAAHRKQGERVWHEDASDGYRTELTRSFPAPATASHASQETVHPLDPDRPARSRYLARYGRSSRPGRWF